MLNWGVWIQDNWRKLVGGAFLLWQFLRGLLELAEHFDFIHEHARNPGWVGDVIEYLLNPPTWVTVPSIGVGFALLFLDSRKRTGAAPASKKESDEKVKTPPLDKPKTLLEYFKSDFPNCMKTSNQFTISGKNSKSVDVLWHVCRDFSAGTEFVSFYVPRHDDNDAFETCVALSDSPKLAIDHVNKNITMVVKAPGDATHTDGKTLTFSGRVYIYHEDLLTLEQLGSLETLYKNKGLAIQFRGINYAVTRHLQEQASKN